MNNFIAKLVIYTYDFSIAKIALKALEPDNKMTPNNLKILNWIEVDKIIFKVSSSKFERILPTIDEILTSYNVLIESLRKLK
jgi:hypothetical protein